MDNMTEATIDRVLMIDLENCPSQINRLMENLAQYTHVVICYAQSGAKIPIDWIAPLTATVNDNKLKIAKMPNIGKNSADFGIAFWAGLLMAKLPTESHFDIVSNDKDLDHVVNLLKDQGRSAVRVGVKMENFPSMMGSKESAFNGLNQLKEYCAHLLKHEKNRPVKKETLLNNIKSKFKTDDIDPEWIFDGLRKEGVITFRDNRIIYNQNKITWLAKEEEDE